MYDQHLYNKAYLINYTIKYIYFINTINKNLFSFIKIKTNTITVGSLFALY